MKQFRRWKATYWVIAVVWAGLIGMVVILPIGKTWKAVALLALALLSPALSDLFESYETYCEKWQKNNEGEAE